MFFKELCMLYCLVINVHPLCLLIIRISNSFILSCVSNFVNNFFQLFSIHFCSFEEGTENLSFYAVSCLLLSFATALLIYTLQRTKVNNFFKKNSQIGNITKTHNFILHFCSSYTFQIILGGILHSIPPCFISIFLFFLIFPWAYKK